MCFSQFTKKGIPDYHSLSVYLSLMSLRSRKERLEADKALQITNLVLDRFNESRALREFGTTAKRSEEYNAEYKHLLGIHVFGLKRSAFAGAAAFGVLYHGLGLGRLPAAALAGWVAALTCGEHVFNETRTWKRVSTVPLVEGRSVVSDELCSDVVDAYYRRFNIGDDDEPVEHPVLKSIESMAQNCQRRQALERRIRRDRGLDPHVPVSIPPPGVPADYPV
jgi:hypothetical protein